MKTQHPLVWLGVILVVMLGAVIGIVQQHRPQLLVDELKGFQQEIIEVSK